MIAGAKLKTKDNSSWYMFSVHSWKLLCVKSLGKGWQTLYSVCELSPDNYWGSGGRGSEGPGISNLVLCPGYEAHYLYSNSIG